MQVRLQKVIALLREFGPPPLINDYMPVGGFRVSEEFVAAVK